MSSGTLLKSNAMPIGTRTPNATVVVVVASSKLHSRPPMPM